jgi:hypothetical protein
VLRKPSATVSRTIGIANDVREFGRTHPRRIALNADLGATPPQ